VNTSVSQLDWAIIVLYLAAVVGLGVAAVLSGLEQYLSR
jgi:hypothetical protein